MIHRTLDDLKRRILRTKSQKGLQKIDRDCSWANCAVGTKLRELGLDVQSVPNSPTIVKRLVKRRYITEGKRFNHNLLKGEPGIKKALRFIDRLKKLSRSEFLIEVPNY